MDLAEQLLFDILLFLPVASLLRFKAVCKNWFSLIESSAFISEHLKRNRDNMEDNFILLGKVLDQLPYRRKLGLLSVSQSQERLYDIDIGQFWHPVNDQLSLIGYCDGIVCLAHRNEIALWNPALKQLRPMPPPLFLPRVKTFDSSYVSFGIDVKSNDYKLVGIFIEFGDNMYEAIGNQVEVYNLGGDNSWRILHKDDVLPFFNIITCNAISSGKSGKCFWIAHRSGDCNTSILLSFDFSDEVFSTMLLPDGNQYPHRCDYDFDLLDDKVVYFVCKFRDNGRAFDIWMLHEFGVEESWNIIYKVGPFNILDSVFSRRISANGEFLVYSMHLKGIRTKLHLYNLRTQQEKYIQNCNIGVHMPGQIIHYSASLLSLKKAYLVRPTE